MKTRKADARFAKQLIDSGRYMDIAIPELYIRYRNGDVCLKGKRVPAKDFLKFVKQGDSYIPTVCADGYHGDLEFDFTPLLCAGVAEIVTLSSFGMLNYSEKYLKWCYEQEFADDWYEAMERAKAFRVSTSEFGLFATSLKSSYIDSRFPEVRQIYCALMALRIVNPISFCKAIMEGVQLSYYLFLYDNVETVRQYMLEKRDDDSTMTWYIRNTLKKALNFKAVRVTPWCGERFITDGRGAGVGALWLFIYHLYGKYSQHTSQYIEKYMEKPCARTRLNELFKRSLGNDVLGEYLKTGELDMAECDKATSVLISQSDISVLGNSTNRSFCDVSLGEGVHDAHIMWKHAVRAHFVRQGCWIPSLDCHYGSKRNIIQVFVEFALSERGLALEEKHTEANHEKLMSELMERVGADNIRESIAKDERAKAQAEVITLQKQVSSLKQELDFLSKGKAEAEDLVSKKQGVIDGLLAEARELRAKLQSLYEEDEEDLNGVASEPVPNEEMLAFVNQFKLIVLGGIDSMQQRMEDAGFTNFVPVMSRNNGYRGIEASGDFFCVCSKFVSHRDVCMLESRHSDQTDQFFYFNGTSAESLLRCCYKFMKGYLEGTEL